MKIAIQGDLEKSQEILQILESLGGENRFNYKETYSTYYYTLDNNTIMALSMLKVPKYLTTYTLEEFEKEFPFKIGEKIKYITSIAIIKEYCYINNEPAYKVESMELGIVVTVLAKLLEPYKEMEIRNITLTLDKAKEWYKKGGELREIALQAFTRAELNPLPKSWEEFCKQGNLIASWRYHIPTKYEALFKLEHLRDCWWGNWKPEWNASHKYAIKNLQGELTVIGCSNVAAFLVFPTGEMAEEFLKCFRDMIELAKDLI